MSSGEPSRAPEDTRGHAIRTVRDREAPGSTPGPPTIFVFKTRDFRRRPEPTDRTRVTISLATSRLALRGTYVRHAI
jgi:hypothetical protein